MTIIVETNNPAKLLKAIKEAIDEGNVQTWSYDSDGDFTHDTEQWNNKAWLRPKIYTNELKFGILSPKDTRISKPVYGIYHGRFIEMLLVHFDTEFSKAIGTAMPTAMDVIQG